MLTADSSPMPSKSRDFARQGAPAQGSRAHDSVPVRKVPHLPLLLTLNVAIAGCSPPACGLPSWRADSGRFADGGRRMFGEMAVLIHVHPRLALHGDEFKVRVALRALAVRMHQALCAPGGHDYLQRVADNRIFLQCVSCGHETPGWRIDIALRAGPRVESGVRR